MGVQTLGIVASNAERARLYFRFRPPRCRMGADPDLVTHGAYGVPRSVWTPELLEVRTSKYLGLARALGLEVGDEKPTRVPDRADGFNFTEADAAEARRHEAQLVAQFLLDRDGIVRWANIECAKEGLAGLDNFPAEEEFLAAVRALPR